MAYRGQDLHFQPGVEHSRKTEGTTLSRTHQEALCSLGGERACEEEQRREQPLTMALWTSAFLAAPLGHAPFPGDLARQQEGTDLIWISGEHTKDSGLAPAFQGAGLKERWSEG